MTASDHPEDVYAEYVDGTLPAPDAERVEAHLAACARCREEVERARSARDALGSLREVPAPVAARLATLREARRPVGAGWRVAAAVAIAASLVAGAVVVLQRGNLGGPPRTGIDRTGGGAEAGGGPQGETGAPEGSREGPVVPIYRASNLRYEFDDMPAVGARLERAARQALAAGFPRTERAFLRAGALEAAEPLVVQAVRCSDDAVTSATELRDPGVPFAFEEASFFVEQEGAYVPGYVAAFLRAPSPGEPFESLLFTVVDRTTCDRLLYYAQPLPL